MTESSHTLAFQRLFFMRSGGFHNVFALFARHLFIEVEIRRCSFDGLVEALPVVLLIIERKVVLPPKS
jgi:hypothetical protein